MILVHIILKDNLKVVSSPLGDIYEEEATTLDNFLKFEKKTWEDIDLRSVFYRSNKRIPYRCGNFKMIAGALELEGYHICFKYKEQIFGKRPDKK
jgi:hypothetical protein